MNLFQKKRTVNLSLPTDGWHDANEIEICCIYFQLEHPAKLNNSNRIDIFLFILLLISFCLPLVLAFSRVTRTTVLTFYITT